MRDAVHNDKNSVNRPPKEENKSVVNYYVIGAVVLAVIALVAYQMFGCASCYAPI